MLSPTEILSSSEYKLESKTSTGSVLLIYASSPPTPPPQSPSPIDSPPSYNYNMSQINFHKIIRQQQKQIAAMQVQIQALLEGEAVAKVGGGATKVAKPQIFDGMSSKVAGFIMVGKLYIRMKLREELVEEQVQWILSYVQGGTADVWHENVMEELEEGEVEYEIVEEFLSSLKKEFGGGEEESMKAVELRKLEQEGKMMEKFLQEFKRAARASGYEGRPLIEEFKKGMNGTIRRKLMEAKNQPASIEQ